MKVSDRDLAGYGLVVGVFALIVAGAALVLAFLVLPGVTENDLFCYRTSDSVRCYFTRVNCEASEKQQVEAGTNLTQRCRPEEAPFDESFH